MSVTYTTLTITGTGFTEGITRTLTGYGVDPATVDFDGLRSAFNRLMSTMAPHSARWSWEETGPRIAVATDDLNEDMGTWEERFDEAVESIDLLALAAQHPKACPGPAQRPGRTVTPARADHLLSSMSENHPREARKPTMTATIAPRTTSPALEWDTVYEADDGEPTGWVMGWDIHGYVSPDTVDLFLTQIDEDDDLPFGDFDVTHMWRTLDADGCFSYHRDSVNDSTPVTRIVASGPAPFWCLNHPWEPATAALPAPRFTDGPRVALEQLGDDQQEQPGEQRLSASMIGGVPYLHMCQDCAAEVKRREQQRCLLARAATVGATHSIGWVNR